MDDAGRYQAFVLGSALHNQSWMPAAAAFVRQNASVLAHRPVWLFSVGMPGALGRRWRRFAMTEKPKELAEFDKAVRPVEHRLFSGVVQAGQLPAAGRLIFRLLGGRYGDFRDWPAITTWAEEVDRRLGALEGKGAA